MLLDVHTNSIFQKSPWGAVGTQVGGSLVGIAVLGRWIKALFQQQLDKLASNLITVASSQYAGQVEQSLLVLVHSLDSLLKTVVDRQDVAKQAKFSCGISVSAF